MRFIAPILLFISPVLLAAEITVRLPEGAQALRARAIAADSKAPIQGQVTASAITFAGLDAKSSYDIAIDLAGGIELQGVNLGWHSSEPPEKNAGPLTDDDVEEIRAIVQDVRGFFNRNRILLTQGTHDRVTSLVELVRDKAFHADRGGEIIWHIELWYFKFQNGGWEKAAQQNRVLKRQRFDSRKDFEDQAGKIRWMGLLGGIKPADGAGGKPIILPAALVSAPASNTTEHRR